MLNCTPGTRASMKHSTPVLKSLHKCVSFSGGSASVRNLATLRSARLQQRISPSILHTHTLSLTRHLQPLQQLQPTYLAYHFHSSISLYRNKRSHKRYEQASTNISNSTNINANNSNKDNNSTHNTAQNKSTLTVALELLDIDLSSLRARAKAASARGVRHVLRLLVLLGRVMLLLVVIVLLIYHVTNSSTFDYTEEHHPSLWVKGILQRLPFRFVSSLMGWVSKLTIPTFARESVYRAYGSYFGVNFDEIRDPLDSFQCLGDFFARHLKADVRPLDPTADLVSPVDGRVLYFGRVNGDRLEQVKGITYSLGDFVGESLYPIPNEEADHDLYHCIIYLAPGDYHGVHSPTDWRIEYRRHFPGYLLPVAPAVAKSVAGLFALNERVVLKGEWAHGFFSLTPVGATNVGSIHLEFDRDVITNRIPKPKQEFFDRAYNSPEGGIKSTKGSEVAFFHLGSTVVLIFESPEFRFTVNKGQKVRIGEKLGVVANPQAPLAQRQQAQQQPLATQGR